MTLVVDNIAGVKRPVIRQPMEKCVLCPPLRLGCSAPTTATLTTARAAVRTAARTTSGTTPISVARCSVCLAPKKIALPNKSFLPKSPFSLGLFLFQIAILPLEGVSALRGREGEKDSSYQNKEKYYKTSLALRALSPQGEN